MRLYTAHEMKKFEVPSDHWILIWKRNKDSGLNVGTALLVEYL